MEDNQLDTSTVEHYKKLTKPDLSLNIALINQEHDQDPNDSIGDLGKFKIEMTQRANTFRNSLRQLEVSSDSEDIKALKLSENSFY